MEGAARVSAVAPDGLGLLERGDDLAAIAGLISAAVGGDGRLGLVEGPAGIGKTVLLDECRRRASGQGACVVHARASELEQGFAYGVVRQLFEAVVGRLPARERTRLFDGGAGPAALVLGAEHGAGADASFAILHGLYWVVVGLTATSPLVVFVDDAQWADRASLRFLLHLGRRLEGMPVAVLLGLRTAEPEARDALLDELWLVEGALVRRPAALSEDAVAAVVRDQLAGAVDEDFCRSCRRATGGNPLYLRELLRSLDAEAVVPSREQVERVAGVWPASIARHVLRRVARVGPGAAELASAMAVLGDGGRLRHAAALAGVHDAGPLARALLEMDVLSQEEPFCFLHPIVRGAVYGDLTPDRRERLHLDAARLTADEGGDDDLVAAHLLAVTPAGRTWCVDALRSAARNAILRGVPETAVTYLRRALPETLTDTQGRIGVLRELGLAEEHCGDPAVIGHLEEARELCRDPAERVLIGLDLALVLETRGLEVEAVQVIRAALAEVTPLGDRGLQRRVEAALVSASAVDARGMAADTVELLGRLLTDVPDGEPGQTVLALAAGVAVWTGQPVDAGVWLADQACARGLLEGEQWDAIGGCLWALILCERYASVAAHLGDLRRTVERRGHTRGLALVHQIQGNRAEKLGSLAEAEASARLALEIARDRHFAVGSISWIVCSLVDALVARGDLVQADAALSLMPADPWPPHLGCVSTLAARGRLRLAQDRPSDALTDLLEVGRLYAEWPYVPLDGTVPSQWRSSAALALHQLGDAVEAQRLAAAELEAARAFGGRRAIGVALRVAGTVAPASEALPLLHEAVEVLLESEAALERARAQVALGVALRRRGERVAAREPLRQGLDGARRCGANALIAFAGGELKAAGARPRREALSGLAALTTSERRVADLAAQGLSNRQLAQALYLSPKTIEMHLGRVYRKLDIGSRGELADALAPA